MADNIKIVLNDSTELIVDAINFPASIIKTCASKEEVASVWGFLTDDNMLEMHVWENGAETMVMKGYTLDGVQAMTNTDGTVTAHFYLRDGQYTPITKTEKEGMDAETAEILFLVEKYGGFKTEVVQSDKIGFDWKNEYLGDILLAQTYVAQDNPTGTADNPIEYYEGCPLIDNAYYMKDGTRYVYMSSEWVEF